jgi:hypothetical protein
MTTKPDDLEAVRTIAEKLEPFDELERERILRWVREKLGMLPPIAPADSAVPPVISPTPTQREAGQDISSFIANKAPVSDVHFAATVAYYYQFVAPPKERKNAITREDLVDACRKAPRNRPKRPAQVLVNAYHDGFLDRGERGQYSLNSVGENLVAMVLPGGRKATVQKQAPRAHKQPLRKSGSAARSSHRGLHTKGR